MQACMEPNYNHAESFRNSDKTQFIHLENNELPKITPESKSSSESWK